MSIPANCIGPMGDSFQSATLVTADHVLRCIGCGEVCGSPAEDFRCAGCGDLLEAEFPGWKRRNVVPNGLKSLWRNRRSSDRPLDASGVWRFREMLPALDDWSHAITLREGNTPVYELPGCAVSA